MTILGHPGLAVIVGVKGSKVKITRLQSGCGLGRGVRKGSQRGLAPNGYMTVHS